MAGTARVRSQQSRVIIERKRRITAHTKVAGFLTIEAKESLNEL